MPAKKGMNTVQAAEELAAPVLEEMGLRLWDVRYEKEGAAWYLRFFIDKDGGVNINDCENFSRNIEVILDEEDPIPHSYTLEVSSPGIERILSKPWHFTECIGKDIDIRLIRPYESRRQYRGGLVSFCENTITIKTEEDTTLQFNLKDTAKVRLYFDYENGGCAQ